jgi:hypothetical protein
MSPTNPDVIYYGGNVVFKTTDGGRNWTIISPDLTTDDKEKQKPSGGPITADNTRAEFHCTIVSIAESPRDPQVIWAGTDDGNLQITRDGGDNWTNVAANIPGRLQSPLMKSVQASWKEAGTAYLAIDQHFQDDFRPHAFMTTDYGRTWKDISKGLSSYTHIVMEDPREPTLLYAGTELGILASFDRGENWTDLRLGEPPISVLDMKVHPRENDLIIASHAGGFYILDDITPLQQLERAMSRQIALFPPMQATRYVQASDTSVLGNAVWVARNKPYGAIISYYLADTSKAPVQVAILDPGGTVVQMLNGTGNRGVNRLAWGLQGPGCEPPGVDRTAAANPGERGGGRGGDRGPRVMPGEYRVRLTAFDETVEQSLSVRLDPRLIVKDEDLAIYHREVTKMQGTRCSIRDATRRIVNVEEQLANLEGEVSSARLRSLAASVGRELTSVRDELMEASSRLRWLVNQVGNHIGRPTAAQIEWIGIYDQRVRRSEAKLEALWIGDLVALNTGLQAAGLPVIRID